MNILIEFKGEKYWWLKNEDGSGALANLSDCDEKGNVGIDTCFNISFAHVMADGDIKRFGNVIGNVEDLKFLPTKNN